MIEEPRIEPPRETESDFRSGPAGREDVGLDEIEEIDEIDEDDELDEDIDEDEEDDDEEAEE
jgi:hypothetical protein